MADNLETARPIKISMAFVSSFYNLLYYYFFFQKSVDNFEKAHIHANFKLEVKYPFKTLLTYIERILSLRLFVFQ